MKMQNQSYRYALLCLAARLLLANVQDAFPSFQPELVPAVGTILTIFVLMLIAYCTASKER